jgi:serpin B
VGGNNAFAFAFYQAIRGEEGNIVYSPHSISLALAMTYAGARGETEQQMAETLHYTLPQDRLHPAFNAVDLALASRGSVEGEGDGDTQGFQLDVANTLWCDESYSIAPGFLDLLAQNYGAGVRLVDFAEGDLEHERQIINEWTSEQTNGQITDVLPPDSITEDTRLILANAVYFRADWFHPFSANATHGEPFTLLDGTEVTVQMMRQGWEWGSQLPRYAQGEGYQAVDLPYEGGDVAMLILLPDAGQFTEFEDRLDSALLDTVLGDLSDEYAILVLSMPRFDFESPSLSLVDTLSEMGMPIAFSILDADFLGMIDGQSDDWPPFISDVIHRARIRVDEEGTEAAAVTVVEEGPGAEEGEAPPPPIIVRVDRPFIFTIYDRPTGTILFMGRVVDPR